MDAREKLILEELQSASEPVLNEEFSDRDHEALQSLKQKGLVRCLWEVTPKGRRELTND